MQFFKKTFSITIILCIAFSISCSTKKNTLVTRSFHNLTSHFNGFFYATESVKEGVAKIEQTHKDDYTKVLPLFIYATPIEAKGIYAEMDRAIKKSSLVVQRHTITDKKGEEIPGAVKWIDDNYLLIGRAQFYKHDYFLALESFDYVAKEYKKQNIHYTALFWMIRTYNEMGRFSLSEPIITLLNNDKKLPQKLMGDFAAVSADYYMQRGDFHNAIKPLIKAITFSKKRKERIRYTYILAQLYQKEGEAKQAANYYHIVAKMNANYEMAFNAKLNRAKLFDINSNEGSNIKKELLKMSKDAKNAEYLDQIYYVLAEVSEKENDMPTTTNYLKLSVNKSVNNNIQKSLSYLKLADISFAQTEYKTAATYYDSTMAILSKDYPEYERIADRKKSLTELVNNLTTIEQEDSLQQLAKMTDKEINAIIEKKIASIEQEEKRQAELKETMQEQNNNLTLNPSISTQNTNPQQVGGMWYFYNSSTISFGVAEFTKKWGNRQREDNWRRSNKESVLLTDADNPAAEQSNATIKPKEANAKNTNSKDKKYYLKNIPLTAEQLNKSNEVIIEALYNIGSIYKEQLQNNTQAAKTFEELLVRYKDTKYKLSVYYQLYRIYLAMGDTKHADVYKNMLITNYPETEYARLITAPESQKGTAANLSEIEQFYTETYEAYASGKYKEVISRCRKADSIYFKNPLMPKFDYIKALSIGKTQNIKAFELALTQVIVKYPKNEVKKSAQAILDVIKNKNPNTDTLKTKEKYQLNETSEYYWIVVISNKNINLNAVKIALSDFNNKSYSSSELTINANFLDSAKQMIAVMKFPNKEKAMDYYDFLNIQKEVFNTIANVKYTTFIISSDNYTALYQQKDLEGYMNFFRKSFLKK